MNTAEESPAARAARGALWLDEERPGWAARVNPDTLNMVSECGCVLGQLYGSFNIGANGRDHGWACFHGFFALNSLYARGDALAEDWNGLHDAWVQEITKRRGT